MSAGRPRHDLLIRLATDSPRPLVDVGADHGRVARAVHGIATERRPHRRKGSGHWVIADGLAPFGPLGTAVIAGMGARTIAKILDKAPPLERAILHAQDDPPSLRRYLAEAGWAIVEEALAPEAHRFAEVIVAEPGFERSTGLELHFGPRLIAGSDPHRSAHFGQLQRWLRGVLKQAVGSPAEAKFTEHLAFVSRILEG